MSTKWQEFMTWSRLRYLYRVKTLSKTVEPRFPFGGVGPFATSPSRLFLAIPMVIGAQLNPAQLGGDAASKKRKDETRFFSSNLPEKVEKLEEAPLEPVKDSARFAPKSDLRLPHVPKSLDKTIPWYKRMKYELRTKEHNIVRHPSLFYRRDHKDRSHLFAHSGLAGHEWYRGTNPRSNPYLVSLCGLALLAHLFTREENDLDEAVGKQTWYRIVWMNELRKNETVKPSKSLLGSDSRALVPVTEESEQ